MPTSIFFSSISGGEPAESEGGTSSVPVIQTTTLTGPQSIDLTAGCSLLRLNNASLLTINGLSAGLDGQRLDVISIGAGLVLFNHESGSVAAANRLINFVTVGSTPLSPGIGVASFVYDATTARWRLNDHEQGASINVAFSAGNFASFDNGTWVVEVADQGVFSYYVRGRHVTVSFGISSTTVTGTPGELRITIPGGYQALAVISSTTLQYNSGGAGWFSSGLIAAEATAPTWIALYKQASAAWAAGTNNTSVAGAVTFVAQ